jgi:hypothetical protein
VKVLGITEAREARVVTGLADAATTGTVADETGVTVGRLVWIGGVGSVGRGVVEDGADVVLGVDGTSILICATVVAILAAASLTTATLSFCCLLRLALRWFKDFFVFAMPCCCW